MANAKIDTILLFVLASVAVGLVLRFTGQIFIPLVIAVLFSYVLLPIVTVLSERYRVPRIVSILFVLVLFLAIGFLIGLVIFSSMRSLVSDFPTYQRRLSDLIEQIVVRYNLPANLMEALGQTDETVRDLLFSISGSFLSFLIGLMLVITFMLFILIEQQFIQQKLVMAFKPQTTRRLNTLVGRINTEIGRYLGVKLFVSLLTAMLVTGAFLLIGVDFPIIWGTITFLFNFIPGIGSIAIAILATLFAIVQFLPQWNLIILTAISISFIQMIIGNFVEPQLLGGRLNLSPVLIILSLLLWGWLWGIVGMFLAIPIVVAIKITLQSIPATRPFATMMGGMVRQLDREH